MPPDPEPLPAGGPAVTDQMLHLLHDSRDRWATGITATLHHWRDMAAVLTQAPDSMRRLWFGGLLSPSGPLQRQSSCHVPIGSTPVA